MVVNLKILNKDRKKKNSTLFLTIIYDIVPIPRPAIVFRRDLPRDLKFLFIKNYRTVQ